MAETDKTTEFLVWVDIETFGLKHNDPVLEVGVHITDLDLNTVATLSELVWGPTYREHQKGADEWVVNTHTKNGLFEAAFKHGHPTPWVDDEMGGDLAKVFQEYGIIKPPWTGSSVHFDEGRLQFFFPKISALFGYRQVNVSTLKELCKRYNPELYAKLGTCDEYAPKREMHRVIPDLVDSVEEFRFYKENFLYTTKG